MTELQRPNRAIPKDTRAAASDDDLESQRPISTLTRHQAVLNRDGPKWYKIHYFQIWSQLTRPIVQTILLQSIYKTRARDVLIEQSPPPSLAIEPHTPSSVEPLNQETSKNTLRETQQIDENFNSKDKAMKPKGPSSISSSTFVVYDEREDYHKARCKEIEEYLDPLLPLLDAPRNRFILIC